MPGKLRGDYTELIDPMQDVTEELQDCMDIIADEEIEEKQFDIEDQAKLTENDYSRFMPPSPKIAHALIFSDASGTKFAKQFPAPCKESVNNITWRPITNISEEISDGSSIVRASTPNGTKMISKSAVQVATSLRKQKATQHTLLTFSPETEVRRSKKRGSLWKDQATVQAKSLKYTNKSDDWLIKPEDIPKRDAFKFRTPDQKSVMGHSAWNECAAFYDEYKGELSAQAITICRRNMQAKEHYNGGSQMSQWRWEWLHGKAWSLTSMGDNPQTATNLAAAPKWVNNLMMIVERTAKWHALHRPKATITGKFKFKIVPNSDIMRCGHIKFSITENDMTVDLKLDLDPWNSQPALPIASDIMQTTLVTNGLLLSHKQLPIQKVQQFNTESIQVSLQSAVKSLDKRFDALLNIKDRLRKANSISATRLVIWAF